MNQRTPFKPDPRSGADDRVYRQHRQGLRPNEAVLFEGRILNSPPDKT